MKRWERRNRAQRGLFAPGTLFAAKVTKLANIDLFWALSGWALGRAGARLGGRKSKFLNSPETPFQGPIRRIGSLLGALAALDSSGERLGPPEVVPRRPPRKAIFGLAWAFGKGASKIARPITPRRPNRSPKFLNQRCENGHAQHAQRSRRARTTLVGPQKPIWGEKGPF